MTDAETKSKPEKESQESGFNFPFGNFGEMCKKMQEFCCGSEGSSNCSEMMQRMFSSASKEEEE